MSEAKLPQRYDLVGEYDSYMLEVEDGDYVMVEDLQPLLAEIERLRARVEVLERIRAAADDLFEYNSGWSHWNEKYRALRATLKEAQS